MKQMIAVSSFLLEGRKYEIGDVINANDEQKKRIIAMGLAKMEEVVITQIEEKEMEKAPIDKMVKSAPKKKSRIKKKK